MSDRRASTHDKALRVNIDEQKHGTFAEIGAGQEVARWFFHVGGAAGTVAKTISAYDMAVSDALYGKTERYVSRRRLLAMLDEEWERLLELFAAKDDRHPTLFVFADTMATRSYSRHEDGQGWMGIRFRRHPGDEPSQIIVHVRLRDREHEREQQAVGILGVNLIHGALYERDDPAGLVSSLADNLDDRRVDIDALAVSGPGFEGVDNRLLVLQLVEQDFTDAVMFTAEGEVVQPAEVLHGKPVIVERGSFRPPTRPMLAMIDSARSQSADDVTGDGDDPVSLMEMSLRSLRAGDRIDHEDFLVRADLLGALGENVMISRLGAYHSLVSSLRDHTDKPILLVLGIRNLRDLFDEGFYEDLPGGVLEAAGRLFRDGVRLYVYPNQERPGGPLTTVRDVEVPRGLTHLYEHLLDNGLVRDLREVDRNQLHVAPGDVLEAIRQGRPGWEDSVPPTVARMIRERGYFGFAGSPETSSPSRTKNR